MIATKTFPSPTDTIPPITGIRTKNRRPTSNRRIKYRFSRNFNRVDLGHFQDAADDIKGHLSRFLLDAAYREIRKHPARVVIIDNISFLSRATGNSAGVRLIKTFKTLVRHQRPLDPRCPLLD